MFSTRSASVKPRSLIKAVPHIVAVEHHRVNAARVQTGLHQVGDRGFSGAGKPGEPQHRRTMVHKPRALDLAHGQILVMDIGGPA